MEALKEFYWRHIVNEDGIDCVIMGKRNIKGSGENFEAWVSPSKGSNLCRLSFGDKNIIDYDKGMAQNDWFLGTPVLYPTPNRVKDGVFTFKGVDYHQMKNGRKILQHGLIHDEEWKWSEPHISSDSISFKTWFEFNKDLSFFKAFPFERRLTLEFSLTEEGIKIIYTVENESGMDLPFGFALHPYFMKLSGEDHTLISVPADSITDCKPPYMPTGSLIPVEGTRFDLRKPVSVGSRLEIDNNYTNISVGQKSEIFYESLNMKVYLEASEEFSHAVVYTPKGRDYFCIENQTCSINAHNFYNEGFIKESGLIIVPAGKSHSGFVSYTISFYNT